MWDALLDILFPRFCVGCGAQNTQLCTACVTKLPPSADSPSPHIRTVFQYKDPLVRTIIWHLKYRGKYPLAKPIARAAKDILFEDLCEYTQMHTNGTLLVIPIPLSGKRFRKRGYNQAAYIAQEFTKEMSAFCTLETRAIKRTRDTQAQMKIENKRKRMENVKMCFSIHNPARVKNADILLIDDVTTTGATLLEARKVLLAAGARTVLCIAVAH